MGPITCRPRQSNVPIQAIVGLLNGPGDRPLSFSPIDNDLHADPHLALQRIKQRLRRW